jgi:hypothetical protein
VYEKPAQAFSVVVQLGGAKSIRNDERKSGDAEAAIRKHHHLTRNINAASESLHAKIQWMKYLAPDSGINRTSSMRSTSTSGGWTLILRPLNSRKRQVILPNTSARGHI